MLARTGRGERVTEDGDGFLVVGLSVTTDRSEAGGRRDFQDQSAISSGTQKTNHDSIGSWTPMLSTEGEWTSGHTLRLTK